MERALAAIEGLAALQAAHRRVAERLLKATAPVPNLPEALLQAAADAVAAGGAVPDDLGRRVVDAEEAARLQHAHSVSLRRLQQVLQDRISGTRAGGTDQALDAVRAELDAVLAEVSTVDRELAGITTPEGAMEAGPAAVAPEDEKDLLVATDVLSEGQNLQQARYIVNYDMPWNPMRLVQRNGRIDRLNSPFAGQEIYLYNLFPAGQLDEVLGLYERLLRKIAHANVSVGMEAPVFEDAAATERNFADTAEQIRGIAAEDEGILDAAEAHLDAFSGEEFRMELRSALAAERLRELLAMPHGAGSGFRGEELPEGARGVFFCVRVLLGERPTPGETDERAWRYVDLATPADAIVDELEILRLIRCRDGTPREVPDDVAPTLYDLWDTVQRAILEEYEERLDPASAATRIPSSQAWAIDLLAREGAGLAERGMLGNVLREAASALSVPRGPLVLRQLSALRRDLRNRDTTPVAAALRVLEVIEREGLRPPAEELASRPPVLTSERVRLICYQVVQAG